jgi:opacity protein-like surface antigen
MKSILSLVLMIFIIVFGAVAKADTSVGQVTSNSYGDSFPRIRGDYLIWQGFNDGQWDVFLWDGSETQAMSDRSDPGLYLTDVYGVTLLATTVHDEEEVDAWALMLAGKLSKSGKVPSLGFSRSLSSSDSDTKACGKFGAGIGYFPTKNLSLGLEGSYVFGLGDFAFDLGFFGDREMDISYFIFTLGAAYHF